MKILFSVDSPKIEKRSINRGEDAPPVNKDGIMIICDGTGATGQSEHMIDGETYTSAYLGSRETSRLAEGFLSENYDELINAFGNIDGVQKIIIELGDSIRKGLKTFVQEKQLKRTIHGKSFKLLPTTFTAVVYKIHPTKIDAIVLSAGDSPVLWWDTDGLHQLSTDDFENDKLYIGDCNVNNCVSADADFNISFACYTLPPKGILLASSDGFTDPIKPFDQERYLIEWIGNYDGICEQNAQELSLQIAQKMDDIKFTQRDDCSIAGVIVGYDSEKDLKDEFRQRYSTQLIEPYIKPYKNLNKQCSETEIEFNQSETAFYKNKENIVHVITDGILNYLETHYNTYDLENDSTFNTLMNADVISTEIEKEQNRIEKEQKENLALHLEYESELKNEYLSFSLTLCRDFGSTRFPEDIVLITKEFFQSQERLNETLNLLIRKNKSLKELPEINNDAEFYAFVDELSATTKLKINTEIIKSDYLTCKQCREKLDKYFNFENEEINCFLEEDLGNNFEILKKLTTNPLFTSKKQKAFTKCCEKILELNSLVKVLKRDSSDEVVHNKKFSSYRRIIQNHAGIIAKELFDKDKYQEYLSMVPYPTDFSDLKRHEHLKEKLAELITIRDSVLAEYNKEYQKYLSASSVKGMIWFRKEIDEQYENN